MCSMPGAACTIATSVANAASSKAGMPKDSMQITSKASGVIWILLWRSGTVPCDSNAIECTPAGFSHQASVFKIHASVYVQLSPMTFGAARREALSKQPSGKCFLEFLLQKVFPIDIFYLWYCLDNFFYFFFFNN